MIVDLQSRVTKLILVVVLLVITLVGLTLALVGLSTPGYAGQRIANPILEAFLERTPTPVPTPVGAACGVRIVQLSGVATDTVTVELSNDGADATVQAITLAWPATNGALTDVLLGGRSIWAGSESGGSTTLFPDLAQLLPTIKAGEDTSLTLRFAKRAAPEARYVLLLHLGKSCYSLFDSQQTTSFNQSCFATFDRFFVNEQEAELVVRNTTENSISLKRMLIFWPYERAAIRDVRLDDGASLILEPAETSPLELELPAGADATLDPGETAKLSLVFDSAAPLVNYAIAFQTDGCQSVFANPVAPSACPVRQDGDVAVVGRTAGLVLENVGKTSRPLSGIWMTFPATNSALVDVLLDDTSIVDESSGGFPKASSPASMTAGVELLPDVALPPNTRSALAFVFQEQAAGQHYTVELNLSEGCRVLSSTRTEDPEPCQVDTEGEEPLRAEGNKLFLSMRNTGSVQAELRALQVDWAAHFNGALIGVSVKGVPFWTGERREGTATVVQNTDAVVPALEPGEVAEVELTFENETVLAPYVFRLDFAGGCQLAFATQDDLTMPTPVETGGTIEQLPANAFEGVWQIRSGNQVIYAQVTPQTVVRPQGLTPLVGDWVRIRMLPIGENEYLATEIRVFPNVAEQTDLSGLIEEVVTDPAPGFIVVQGVRIEIMLDTVINGDLVVGWEAEVKGWERADGSVLAEEITATQPQDNTRRVDFQGPVEGWYPDPVSDVESVWVISGINVVVNRDTTIHHGIEPGTRPETGVETRVAGNMDTANTVYAREIWYGPGTEIQKFEGIIRQLPDVPDDEPLLGIWIIEDAAVGTCDLDQNPDAAACKEVLVTSSTFLDMSQAVPTIGAPVEVSARENSDARLEALRITILLDED